MIAQLVNHAHVFPASMNAEGTIERLLTLLDACQIEQVVCFAPFPHQCDFDPNAWLADELKKNSRLLGFGTVDVRRDDLRDQVRRLRDMGFKGMKLHPNAQDFSILSPHIFKIYQAAEEMGMFITFHTGVHHARLKNSRVIDFDEVAWEFPKLKFSMEHVGGYHFFKEALAVLFNHVPPPWEKGESNVFAGLASIFTMPQLRFWHLTREQLLELVGQVGVDQMIFGLDFPYNKERETQNGIETIQSLGLSDVAVAKILGGNLKRALGLSDLPATERAAESHRGID
jgi:predicted TIM-barrel fold metal-dependent hydrolase